MGEIQVLYLISSALRWSLRQMGTFFSNLRLFYARIIWYLEETPNIGKEDQGVKFMQLVLIHRYWVIPVVNKVGYKFVISVVTKITLGYKFTTYVHRLLEFQVFWVFGQKTRIICTLAVKIPWEYMYFGLSPCQWTEIMKPMKSLY